MYSPAINSPPRQSMQLHRINQHFAERSYTSNLLPLTLTTSWCQLASYPWHSCFLRYNELPVFESSHCELIVRMWMAMYRGGQRSRLVYSTLFESTIILETANAQVKTTTCNGAVVGLVRYSPKNSSTVIMHYLSCF